VPHKATSLEKNKKDGRIIKHVLPPIHSTQKFIAPIIFFPKQIKRLRKIRHVCCYINVGRANGQ
jgi:hypothetical protein